MIHASIDRARWLRTEIRGHRARIEDERRELRRKAAELQQICAEHGIRYEEFRAQRTAHSPADERH